MMEDQMANIKIKLELDHYAVIAGSDVTLKATLSKPEGQPTKDEIEELDFSAPEGTIVDKTYDGSVVTAKYRPPSTSNFKKIDITATLGTRFVTKQLTVLDRNLRFAMSDPAPATTPEGGLVNLETTLQLGTRSLEPADVSNAGILVQWITKRGEIIPDEDSRLKAAFDTTGLAIGKYEIKAQLVDVEGIPILRRRQQTQAEPISDTAHVDVLLRPLSRGDVLSVTLRRTTANSTRDKILWSLIRERTGALSFMGGGYKQFIDKVLCDPDDPDLTLDKHVRRRLSHGVRDLGTSSYGMAAYELLKTATEVYLLIECGVVLDKSFDNPGFDSESESDRLGEHLTVGELKNRLNRYFVSGRLPYLDRVVNAIFPDGDSNAKSIFCPGALSSRVTAPCLLELIWSYWHEEGMLVQSMNAISRRFQNVRGPGDRDPLAHLEIDPLRPLNNLLWGYIQDEQNLLTVKRRAYEYDHQYGLRLHGKAVPPLRPADSRSKFLEGFHNLLHVASVFYKEDNDTTVIADGFPLLNALREVHLVMAQGAHNQFGDLPWTARSEMLIQQWLLSQPQMREFLQSRPMVPYKEPWMAQVDTMKMLQGWSDVTVTHFRDLGSYGEQILLTVRYGDWIDVNDEDSAKNWARYWRPEIQGYIHAYRTVTGIDLTNPDTVDYTMPAVHLQRRLAMQRAR
jgi:hypothetical protein